MATISAVVRWADNTADLKRNLSEGLNQIEATRASAEKMVQSLSGDKLIASAHRMVAAIDQIGGATKLTAAEQERANTLLTKAIEKYELLGRQAPEAMRQLAEATKAAEVHTTAWGEFVSNFDISSAFTNPLQTAKSAIAALGSELGAVTAIGAAVVAGIGAIGAAAFVLAKNIAVADAAIGDMADKTGMSVPALSRLSNASKVASVDMGQLATAVFKLQKGMAEDAEGVAKGLGRIGVSFEDFKAAGPDRYIELVAAGLKATVDPAQRAAAMVDIFKDKSGELTAQLLDLDAGLKATADITPLTQEQADAAEAFTQHIASMQLHLENIATVIGRALIPAFDALLSVLDRTVLAFVHIIDLGGLVSGSYRKLTGALGENALAAETAAARQDVINKALSLGAPVGIQFGDAVKYVNDAFKTFKTDAPNAAEALKKWNAELDKSFQKQQEQQALAAALRNAPGSIIGNTFDVEANEAAIRKATETRRKHTEEIAKAKDKIVEMEAVLPQLTHKVGELDDTERAAIKTHLEQQVAIEKENEVLKKLHDTLRALQRDDFASVTEGLEKVGQKSTELEQIKAHLDRVHTAAERNRVALESLADTFVRLGQASGGSLGSILSDIGQMLVLLDAANKEVAKFQKIRDARIGGSADGRVRNLGVATALFAGKDSTGTEKLASAAASAGAIVQGVKNIWSATEAHATRAGNAVGGMLAGFKAGAAFGPWGMAIGAAAGLVVGLIRGKPAWAQAAESVGKDFGVQISKGLADAIAKSAKTDFGGSMQAAQIGALAAIIKEAGGLSEKNLPQMTARLHDVFSMIETHQMTIEQGTKVLEETWGAFAQAGTDSLGLLSPKLVEIIKLQRQFGTESKAIADYVKGQLAGVAEGFNAVAIAIAGPMSKVTDLTKEQIAKLAIDSQEAFDRTTRLAVVAFAAAMASGKGFLAAIDAIGPGLDALAGAMEKLGLQGSDTLNQLLLFRKFAQENKELVAGIDGLNQMMTGLANSGMLTQDVFNDLSATAFDFYQKAMKGGLTSTQALVMMQPTLQRIWQLHKDNGLAIDENTQKMLDEAEANGIVGDAMRSTNEKMLQVLVAIAKVLGADLPEAFDRLGSAADKAAQDAKDAIDKLPKKIDIPIDFPLPGSGPPPIPNPFPETAHSGAMVTADGLQKFHRGTAKVLQFHRGGLARDEVPAILQTGESVLNRQATSFLGGDVIGGLNRGIRGTIGPDGIVINNEITVEVDARGALNDPAAADRIARQIGPAIVKQIQLNVDGMYTKMRGSLGLAS